ADTQAGRQGQLVLIEEYGAWNQCHQLHVVAAIQSEILHLPLVNYPRNFTRGRVYRLAHAACDFHGFGDLPYLERRILRYARICTNYYAALFSSLKTITHHQDFVSSDRQVRGGIKPILVRCGVTFEVGRRVGNCDVGVWYRAAIRIFYRARYATEYCL